MNNLSKLAFALPLMMLSSCLTGNQPEQNGQDGDQNSTTTTNGNKTADQGYNATIYAATAMWSEETDWKSEVLKDGKTLYAVDGTINNIFVVNDHVYFTLASIKDDSENALYEDGKKTDKDFGPDLWVFSGKNTLYFDDHDGQLVNLKGLTEFKYQPDETGSTINEVLDKDGELFISDGQPARIWQNSNRLVLDDAKENIFPTDLQYDNGSLYFKGTGTWEGKSGTNVIYKDKKVVLGGFSPEGKYFVNNGDIYTTNFTDDAAEDKSLIVKNGSEKHVVPGGLETLEMQFHGGKAYTWAADNANNALRISITEDFKTKADITIAPSTPGNCVLCAGHQFLKGDFYTAVVDLSTPNVVKLYRNDKQIQTYNARTYDCDGYQAAQFDFVVK